MKKKEEKTLSLNKDTETLHLHCGFCRVPLSEENKGLLMLYGLSKLRSKIEFSYINNYIQDNICADCLLAIYKLIYTEYNPNGDLRAIRDLQKRKNQNLLDHEEILELKKLREDFFRKKGLMEKAGE